jgi:predicted RNase H-like HicB family nuclease
VSFPDWPGVITAGDTVDEALHRAAEVLNFAAESWEDSDVIKGIPKPRTIDELHADQEFRDDAIDAVIAAVRFRVKDEAAK